MDRRIGWVWAVLFGALALLSPLAAKEKEKKPKIKDLADSVMSNRITTKFAQLLQASNMASFLSSRGPFTLFVPVNSAFSRILPDQFNLLLQPQNQDVLQRIVLFHVVNGREYFAHDLAALKSLPSCEGNPIPTKVARTGYQMVGKAKIIHADIHTRNGMMHEIDTVLLPPGVSLAKLAPPPAAPPTVNTVATPASPDTNAPGAGDTGPLQAMPATNLPPMQ